MISTQGISAITAHLKLIVVGTQMGYIWLMDHFGHVDHQNVPVIRPHRSAVTKLAIDGPGNYIMSCGNDGRVAISGVGCDELNHVINLPVMPRSIVISPSFSKSTSVPMFAIGERKMTIFEKKFFKYKETVIFRGGEKDGFISHCSWQQSLIAFTNDGGTRIFDRLSTSSFFLDRRAEIHFTWHLNMFCSGVSYALGSPGKHAELVVFGLKMDNEADEDASCENTSVDSESTMTNATESFAQLCLLAPKTYSSYLLLAEDQLSLSANRASQPCQFLMAGLPTCESYFLATVSDLVMATPYCAEDTVRWRVENGLLEEAWELACEKHTELENSKWNSRSIGRAMIEHLISSGKPRQAAARMAEVCGKTAAEWEWGVGAFERSRLCTLIAEFLPTTNPQLEPECYETVLQAALYNDVDLFKRLVQQWPPDIYRTGFMTGLTLKRIQEIVSSQSEASRSYQNDEIRLYHALAHLYLHERKFDSALKIYISLKDPHIFAVIDKYQLFEQVKDQVSELMTINTDRALRLLLDNEDNVPASLVMAKIARQPKLQLAYLTKLLGRNEGAEFADQAVRLYAEYDRKKLIPFLRKNENYHIRRALEICRQKNFVEEMILLLGKCGNHVDALDLMIKKYNQLDKAIEYCQEHDDTDLWARLIEEVVETPEHIAHLLNHAGSSIDPLRVIEKLYACTAHDFGVRMFYYSATVPIKSVVSVSTSGENRSPNF
ncbi:hypothetical protein Y032_0791g2368, partial [Ancylostoma ceylanicum]